VSASCGTRDSNGSLPMENDTDRSPTVTGDSLGSFVRFTLYATCELAASNSLDINFISK